MSELLKRNIDIRSNERRSRYGFLSLICPKYKRESEGARTFQVPATRFWNSLPNEKSLYQYFLKSYDHIHHFTISWIILFTYLYILY